MRGKLFFSELFQPKAASTLIHKFSQYEGLVQTWQISFDWSKFLYCQPQNVARLDDGPVKVGHSVGSWRQPGFVYLDADIHFVRTTRLAVYLDSDIHFVHTTRLDVLRH